MADKDDELTPKQRRRRRDRRLDNMTAEERRERLRAIGKAEREGKITEEQERRRRERVRESGDVLSQKRWRKDVQREQHYATLSPRERRRRIQEIMSREGLTKGQRARRIQNVRAGGPIGRKPSRPTDVGTGEDLAPEHLSAYEILKAKFRDYGLEMLAPKIRDMLKDGRSAAEIEIELQETEEWKKRFAGNEQLRKHGLPVLSVAEYLSVEQSYAQIMKNYGLPDGFYNDPSDFADFIGKSVSASEMEQRVSQWSDLARREDPAIKEQLRSMGMNHGDLLAFMMDPNRAAPLIQRKYQVATLGGAARRAGVSADNDYLSKLAGMGVTEQQAQQGYGLISENLNDLNKLGDIYGERYGQRTFEREVFENEGDAAKKRKRLASRERAAFSGDSGVGQGSLSESSAGDY